MPIRGWPEYRDLAAANLVDGDLHPHIGSATAHSNPPSYPPGHDVELGVVVGDEAAYPAALKYPEDAAFAYAEERRRWLTIAS